MGSKKEQPIVISRIPVDSSNLVSIGHHNEKNILEVEFHNGAIWRYSPVTEEAYKDFAKADSIGKWFNQNIKNNTMISAWCHKSKN